MCIEFLTPPEIRLSLHFVEHVLLALLSAFTTPFHTLKFVPMLVKAVGTPQTLTRAQT